MTEIINSTQFLSLTGKLTDISVAITHYNNTHKAITKFNQNNREKINENQRQRANKIYAERGEAYEKIKISQKRYFDTIDRAEYNRAYYQRKLEKARLLKEEKQKLEEKTNN